MPSVSKQSAPIKKLRYQSGAVKTNYFETIVSVEVSNLNTNNTKCVSEIKNRIQLIASIFKTIR